MIPGVYQMSFGGLTVREAWRFSRGLFPFVMALVLKLTGMKGTKLWLPACDAEKECTSAEFSDRAKAALVPIEANLLTLGYGTPLYTRQVRICDPSCKEAFALITLHRDGNRVIHVGFVVSTAGGFERQAVSITGGIMDAQKDFTYDFVSHKNYLDAHGFARAIRVKVPRAYETDEAMNSFIATHPGVARRFASVAEFRARAMALDTKIWDLRIVRGLFSRVADEV